MSAQHVPALGSREAEPAYPLGEFAFKRPLRVALAGPDGVGKSTAIAMLQQWFHDQLPQVSFEVRQWRPSLLPDLGVFVGKPSKPVKKTPPRRHPGHFHLVRLFYYFLDFLIGSWWKDRVRAPAASLIVYDRCALDMYVDPVRFALRSRFGTRLLWKLTPKPDLVVLFHDDPERIWQRKRELQRHEMAEQIATWFDLVRSGDVHAVIRIDAGPEEIAARLRNLVLEKLRWHRPSACAGALAYPAVAAQAEGQCRHAVLHRLLIPLATRRVAAQSLEIYNPQAPLARLAKSVLTAGLRVGIAQPFLKHKCSLDEPLQEHLRHVLGCRHLHCAVSTGTPNRSRKPVLQLMNESGDILGYAKIGWNERTIGLVRNEVRALESLRNRAFSTAIVPSILHAGAWHGRYVLVQSAPRGRVRLSPPQLDDRHIRFLLELRCTPSSLLCLPVAAEKLADLPYYAHLLESGLALSTRALEGEDVPAGFGHGDFAPWNIRLDGDKLLVLDWEYGGAGRPPLWDLFQFVIQTAIELHALPASALYTQLLGLKRFCHALEIPERWLEPLLTAYVCDALRTNLLLHGAAPDHKDRLGRTTLASLLTILCRPGAFTV